LLNVAGFYDKLLAFIDHAVDEGFLKRHHADLLHVSDDPAALIDMLARAPRETVDKWSERRQRT
ncbi:LOG family protein, partial [Escherichia coli]|nr:LOG family protein [Escherichia coli]